jgi:hypothetical protein
MRSSFERGRATSARSLAISASQMIRRHVLGGAPQLADRAVDRYGTHAVLQLGYVGLYIVRGYVRRSLFIRWEQATPVEEIQEAAVVPSMIFARDRS